MHSNYNIYKCGIDECLVKEAVVVSEASQVDDEHEEMLTFGEENAVRYVGFMYVIHNIFFKKPKRKNLLRS